MVLSRHLKTFRDTGHLANRDVDGLINSLSSSRSGQVQIPFINGIIIASRATVARSATQARGASLQSRGDAMKKLSEKALNECVAEIRAACRLPIDAQALETMLSWVRPQFVQILDNADGGKRWADHGQQMRDNGRYLGTFADFFARHTESQTVGIDEITRAFEMLKADCTVRGERTAFNYHYCSRTNLDVTSAEEFLRAVSPAPELA